MLVSSAYKNTVIQNYTDRKHQNQLSLPNFKTSFHNTDLDTYEIAKKMCKDAVSQVSPREKAYIINSNTQEIVSLAEGGMMGAKIALPLSLFSKNKYSIIHGHPTLLDKNKKAYTLPVSFTDFEFLNNNNSVKDITAISKDGKETKLEKLPKYKKLSEKELKNIRNSYFETLYKNLCNKEEQEKINNLYQYTLKEPNSRTIKQNIINKILEKQYCSEAIDVITNFWKNICPNINLKFTQK